MFHMWIVEKANLNTHFGAGFIKHSETYALVFYNSISSSVADGQHNNFK